MNRMNIRTDLALEEHENIISEKKANEINGITMEENFHHSCDTRVTKVSIISKNGANIMHKPMGHYITLESERLSEHDESFHQDISSLLSNEIAALLKKNLSQGQKNILIVGLGNINVTADSLGPRVVDQLSVNRHLIREFGEQACHGKNAMVISSISPGVMAQTGMETAEIIKGIVQNTHPDLLIVVDSLAARSIKRLNTTIQISDTGIQPGSGVGNHRNGITQETMGIPVIAIGVPMVVDAATIILDFASSVPTSEQLDFLPLMEKNLRSLQNLYVTGKDVDEIVRGLSYTVSEGLNRCLL